MINSLPTRGTIINVLYPQGGTIINVLYPQGVRSARLCMVIHVQFLLRMAPVTSNPLKSAG